MAVDPPVLYNGWWVYLRDDMGSTHLNPNDKQIYNAYKMRSALQAQGYCDKAIAGVIGNAQVESSITPGAIQKVSVLPNGAEHLSDVPNSYMLQYYNPSAGGTGYGLGILQWDRLSSTYQTNDLLGWTNANGFQWYDGDGQMARLAFEFTNNATYNFWRMNYGTLTWADYKDIETTRPNYDAAECAAVWDSCWELSSGEGRQYRKDNAAFWYQYFIDHPYPSAPVKPWLLFVTNRRKKVNKRVRFNF